MSFQSDKRKLMNEEKRCADGFEIARVLEWRSICIVR